MRNMRAWRQCSDVTDAVRSFKAKTEELFVPVDGMTAAEIEEIISEFVAGRLEGCGIKAEIAGIAISGSRCRGLEHEGSDLDVVVELQTKEREDVLFDILNEDAPSIGDIPVDINPITPQRTGTLDEYLPRVEEYLHAKEESSLEM